MTSYFYSGRVNTMSRWGADGTPQAEMVCGDGSARAEYWQDMTDLPKAVRVAAKDAKTGEAYCFTMIDSGCQWYVCERDGVLTNTHYHEIVQRVRETWHDPDWRHTQLYTHVEWLELCAATAEHEARVRPDLWGESSTLRAKQLRRRARAMRAGCDVSRTGLGTLGEELVLTEWEAEHPEPTAA